LREMKRYIGSAVSFTYFFDLCSDLLSNVFRLSSDALDSDSRCR